MTNVENFLSQFKKAEDSVKKWPKWMYTQREIRAATFPIKYSKDEKLTLALEALREIEWSNDTKVQSDRAKTAIENITKRS